MERTGSGGDGAAGGRERAAGAQGGADAGAGGATAAIAALAGCVAQAVTPPLSSVISSFRLLSAELDRAAADPARLAAAAPGLRQATADAARGADRLREVVRGLELLARPRTASPREAVDVRAELATAIELARGAVSQRAQLMVALPEALPPVEAAPGELGLAFVTLLLGVAEGLAGAAEGQRTVRVAARSADGRVLVEVTDDGERPASGAGVALAQAMVAAAGGTAEVASAPGRGHTVALALPAAGPAAGAAAAGAAGRAQPAGAPSRGRVLVIDDDPLVGRSMARLLQGAHDVTVLTSPVEAVGRIERGERWDVVLCDLMMPELSGMDVEERVTRVAPELVPRMVYLTGGAFTDKARAFLGGGRPYLEKPVEAPALRGKVAELLRRARGEG